MEVCSIYLVRTRSACDGPQDASEDVKDVPVPTGRTRHRTQQGLFCNVEASTHQSSAVYFCFLGLIFQGILHSTAVSVHASGHRSRRFHSDLELYSDCEDKSLKGPKSKRSLRFLRQIGFISSTPRAEGEAPVCNCLLRENDSKI